MPLILPHPRRRCFVHIFVGVGERRPRCLPATSRSALFLWGGRGPINRDPFLFSSFPCFLPCAWTCPSGHRWTSGVHFLHEKRAYIPLFSAYMLHHIWHHCTPTHFAASLCHALRWGALAVSCLLSATSHFFLWRGGDDITPRSFFSWILD